MKRGHGRSWLRSVLSRVTLALTRTDPVSAASIEPVKEEPAVTYRARPAAEIIKRVGPVHVHREAGDEFDLIAINPRGWHREESFATPRSAYRLDGTLKPSAASQRPVFRDVEGVAVEGRTVDMTGPK